MTRSLSASRSAAFVLGLASSLACDPGGAGDLGAPCESAADCAGDLICDEHEGQGSCQKPHDHGETGDDSTTGDSDSDPTTDPSTTDPSTTDDATTSDATTGGPEETSGGSTSGSTGEPGTTGGGVSAECEALCSCVAAGCSSFGGYPFADDEACHTWCGEQPAADVECYQGFCDEITDPDEHLCEHAWGELGNSEC